MKTMQILHKCPECGNSKFFPADEEGYFECSACGEISLPEEMPSEAVEFDPWQDLANSVKLGDICCEVDRTSLDEDLPFPVVIADDKVLDAIKGFLDTLGIDHGTIHRRTEWRAQFPGQRPPVKDRVDILTVDEESATLGNVFN